MEAATTNRSLIGRMIRAARLEADVYEEVEHDREATRQAAMVVVLTSIAGGIGAGFAFGIGGLVLAIAAGLFGWALYAWITYFIGTRIFAGPETDADWGELARTLAFANSPRALLIVGVVPLLAGVVVTIVLVWIAVATVVALRAALDFSTGRAIATGLVGFIIYGIIGGVLAVLLA
jgi:cytosine/adenosine deaminase-related metal-dependent hydrolase